MCVRRRGLLSELVCVCVLGLNHMISEKQKPIPGERGEGGGGGEEEETGRRIQRRGEAVVGVWLLLVVVVADGGHSLAYCHSPLTGQITSEHCLAGQVQKP